MGNTLLDIFAQQKQAASTSEAAFSVVKDTIKLLESVFTGATRGTFELAGDAWQTGALHATRFGRDGAFYHGLIVYAIPYMGWYRVQIDELNADKPCCRLMQSPGGPMAAAEDQILPPGTPVQVWMAPGDPYGVIQGVIPTPVVNGSRNLSDWITQGGGAGYHRSRYYSDVTKNFTREGGVLNFNQDSPIDQTALGEWGRHMPLGASIHVGNFNAFLRISEACGMEFHWIDNLARLTGYNMDIRTAGSEEQIRNDEGEIFHLKGSTPYPWEALGAFAHGTEITKDTEDRTVQDGGNLAAVEPVQPDLQPFWRRREFGGYLGQGFRRDLLIPNQTSGLNQPSAASAAPSCLFTEQLGVEGAYAIASSHSLSFAKRSMLPIAIQVKTPEDPSGDRSANYKAASQTGDGQEHKVGDPVMPGTYGAIEEALALTDIQAHLFNWKGAHPFHYHENDWRTLEPSQDPKFQKLVTASALSELMQKMFVPPQPTVTLSPDHRYGETPYYQTSSGTYYLKQGGVIHRGAWGEEIGLIGGNIFLACPGNVFFMPGKSLIAMAGDDIINRAHGSFDVSTTKNDIRLQAKNNFEMLAGTNGGQGRFLIENQSQSDMHQYKDKHGEDIQGSGIILKAANSKIIGWSAGMYLRTGGGDIQDGDIILDAAKGDRDIKTISRVFYRHLEQQAADAFPGGANKTVVNSSDVNGSQFDAQVQMRGGAYITQDGLVMRGYLSILDGHIATSQSSANRNLVAELPPGSREYTTTEKALKQVENGFTQLEKALGSDFKDQIKAQYHDDQKIGNDEFQRQATFSWRTEKQYGTEQEFILPEPWWQQLAREAGVSTGSWTEETITNQGKPLMPYPGYDKWTGESMLQYHLQLFDTSTGREMDRETGLYEEFEVPELQKTSPQGGFKTMS